MKLYCGRCEDLYSPKSSRHGSIDGAYFGTTFPHLLFLVYPGLLPPKTPAPDVEGREGGMQGVGTSASSKRSKRREEEMLATGDPGGAEGTSTAAVAAKVDRYRPRIYGFLVNETARLMRWQDGTRDRYAHAMLFWLATANYFRQIARLESIEQAL